MMIRDVVKSLLKNWAMKQLAPANVQAVLTACLAQLRTITEETENKVDDWILDFLESVVLDVAKVDALTKFIHSKLAGVYMDVPPACDGPVNDEYQTLASQLSPAGTYCTSLGQIMQLGRLLADILPILIDFFRERKQCA